MENEQKELLKEYAGIGKALATILVRRGEDELSTDEAMAEHDALLMMANGDYETLSASSQLFLSIVIDALADATDSTRQQVVQSIYEFLIEDIDESFPDDSWNG